MSLLNFCGYIEERRKNLSLSKVKLAQQAHISRSALYRILSGDVREPDSDTIIKLATALHVHPCHLIQQLLLNHPLPSSLTSRSRYCRDGVVLITDTSSPNNVLIPVGSEFTKTWELQNIGHSSWRKRALICIDYPVEDERGVGLIPKSRNIPVGTVEPGEVFKVNAHFHVPLVPGVVASHWKFVDASGEFCFPDHRPLVCQVQVFDLEQGVG